VKVWPLDVGTSGGLVTDEYARALNTDGSAIPGLYAAGNITAPVVGHTYPGAGASIGGGIAFGYVAARHALGANAAQGS
jgi:3-oxosteroid 1-dehydrogenase